ncbi:hypothetical protein M9H77_30087 [Catharanthus roseus]|uniref:Uncharacterized protein n=1 Tax=Catharanthus roseus TaxID=4058 RepID=A0ACB9ZW96_CATRO|nr:hypothetical protein M9H77_30087 [Catharanthus roseus]
MISREVDRDDIDDATKIGRISDMIKKYNQPRPNQVFPTNALTAQVHPATVSYERAHEHVPLNLIMKDTCSSHALFHRAFVYEPLAIDVHTEHKIYLNLITTISITNHILPIADEKINESRKSVCIMGYGTRRWIYKRR